VKIEALRLSKKVVEWRMMGGVSWLQRRRKSLAAGWRNQRKRKLGGSREKDVYSKKRRKHRKPKQKNNGSIEKKAIEKWWAGWDGTHSALFIVL
jgi:hypothetical protein